MDEFKRLYLTDAKKMDVFKISKSEDLLAARAMTNQIAFRYRSIDSATGITRETAKRLAEQLGVDETQAIHRALHELAVKILPQYAQAC